MKSRRKSGHCPRCGSIRLKWASGLPQLWSIYDCLECGYRGPLVIENGELAKKIRKRWLRKKGNQP
ncbi:MAG: hypothetical protein H5T49_01505 [Hadesarchaea archaeon]|nr:hypothetical protein [Hadesarchaea archaeon]